jgi:type IV pilus assembly protein PilB
MSAFKQSITDLLIQNQLITPAQLEELQQSQKASGRKFSSLLLEKKLITEGLLIDLIINTFSLPSLNSSQITIMPDSLAVISPETAREFQILPLLKEGQSLSLLVSGPLVLLDLEEIKELKGFTINAFLPRETNLQELIDRHYAPAQSADFTSHNRMENILADVAELTVKTKEELKLTDIAQITQEVPIIKATNFILEKAIELKASDILIEPLETVMRIRLRIDGILHQIETLPISFHPFIISRIKVISNLDIAEHRLPQDGQFKIKISNKEVEFRVSVIASTAGEKMALRVLDKTSALLDIEKLGLRPESLAQLKAASLMPYGMILVCGPTGSGKTTTLYSILKHIHTSEKNIVTVEDPVEYQIKGINQVSVNTKTGLIFSRCLRAILRQDPNVIMIGEIRDFETVDIAIKAALTGHLVLSTLHTTTAAGSIVRLLDMGVQPFLINAALIAIVSQRLARRICPGCKEKMSDQPYYVGKGCKECLDSGYSGRMLITEILYMSPAIKQAIISEKLEEENIKKLARGEGMRTLREEGTGLALAGITTLEEVLRVTPAD